MSGAAIAEVDIPGDVEPARTGDIYSSCIRGRQSQKQIVRRSTVDRHLGSAPVVDFCNVNRIGNTIRPVRGRKPIPRPRCPNGIGYGETASASSSR